MTGYMPNEKQVISKVIDNEAIIIKLEQGVYYSLNDVGTVIWQKIIEKNTNAAIVDYIFANYSVKKAQAERDVEVLLQKMLKEQLIINTDGSIVPVVEKNVEKKSYIVPEIEAYRDMEDLLALDPPVPGMNDVTWKE